MKKHYYKKKNPLAPLVENVAARLTQADSRFRRSAVKWSAALFSIFVIYSFLAGPYGLFRISRLNDRKAELITENQVLLVGIIDADMTRARLEDDPRYIEYVARTRYLLARPGETVIQLQH